MGTLKDGKTKGFWVLVLATPYRGHAISCEPITYSSKTIAGRQDSRNLNHFRAFAELKDLLGERPLVLDREFSYLEGLLRLVEERVNFVIRLNLGSHSPKFWAADGSDPLYCRGRSKSGERTAQDVRPPGRRENR